MTEKDATARRMSVGEHLEELRRRVILGLLFWGAAFVLCLAFNRYVMGAILRQPLQVLMELGYEEPRLQFLGPTEGFITWLKLAMVVSFFVASPLILWQLWKFVAAGLYPHERRPVRLVAPLSYALFVAGVTFLYFVVMPTALRFLFDFGTDPELFGLEIQGKVVENVPQVSKYLSLYITMSLIMGVVFQLPLVMVFLMITGLVTPATFGKYRRHFVVGAVAVLAVVTPTGDAATLVLVTIPVVLLFEGGLIMGRLVLRRRRRA